MENIALNEAELAAVAGGNDDGSGETTRRRFIPAVAPEPFQPGIPAE